jgi:hypothetical protein
VACAKIPSANILETQVQLRRPTQWRPRKLTAASQPVWVQAPNSELTSRFRSALGCGLSQTPPELRIRATSRLTHCSGGAMSTLHFRLSFDYLVSEDEQREWHIDPEGLCGLQIHHQLKSARLVKMAEWAAEWSGLRSPSEQCVCCVTTRRPMVPRAFGPRRLLSWSGVVVVRGRCCPASTARRRS